MSNNVWFGVVMIMWFAIWSSEVIVAKLIIGEEVPFWMYGIQALFVSIITVKLIKW